MLKVVERDHQSLALEKNFKHRSFIKKMELPLTVAPWFISPWTKNVAIKLSCLTFSFSIL